ncbi:DUF2798 domain-containing protein [Nemorincola caseinilytica]|uniref:DUF2798 domain-containing protein n=1 Tax=Nemorincola caseinilytica TaxID=2054315 RepID=A0ABP8NN05_9BACT
MIKQKIAFAMIMGAITTGLISFVVVSVNIGYNARFLAIWSRSWALAWVVAVPAIMLIAPRVERLVQYLFGEGKRP